MTPVLRLEDVCVTYRSHHATIPVLDRFNLTVNSGECVALAGPSGSGKSTILHVAAALRAPDRGSVTLTGREIASLASDDVARLRAQRVGMVFQAFHLLPHLSSLDNVLVPTWIARRTRAEAAASARAALASVGLATRERHLPASLSGGEQQRVAIARAIVNRPAIVFADEPTGNLDAVATARIADLLAGLASGGTALLIATHDPQIAGIADRVVHVKGDATAIA